MNSNPPTPKPEGLSRELRLRSPEEVTAVFRNGTRLRKGSLQLFFFVPEPIEGRTLGVQAAFAVPKRAHRRAVARNRLKRLLREAYRRNRGPLLGGLGIPLNLLFVYQGRADSSYAELNTDVQELLQRLIQRL